MAGEKSKECSTGSYSNRTHETPNTPAHSTSLPCSVGWGGSPGTTHSEVQSVCLPGPVSHDRRTARRAAEHTETETGRSHPASPGTSCSPGRRAGRKGLEGRRRSPVKNTEGWQAAGPHPHPPAPPRPAFELRAPYRGFPGHSSRAGSKPKAILFSECLKGMEQIATVTLTESHLPLVSAPPAARGSPAPQQMLSGMGTNGDRGRDGRRSGTSAKFRDC